jgi:biotin carboxyl carrier protein
MDIKEVQPGVYSVLDEGRQHEVLVGRNGEMTVVTMRGRTREFAVEDPKNWNGSKSAQAAAGTARILSPMPGKVVRVLAKAGDRVEAGAGVVVVEAMKMQNELKSPIAGVVKKVDAVEGATVKAQEILMVVEANAG